MNEKLDIRNFPNFVFDKILRLHKPKLRVFSGEYFQKYSVIVVHDSGKVAVWVHDRWNRGMRFGDFYTHDISKPYNGSMHINVRPFLYYNKDFHGIHSFDINEFCISSAKIGNDGITTVKFEESDITEALDIFRFKVWLSDDFEESQAIMKSQADYTKEVEEERESQRRSLERKERMRLDELKKKSERNIGIVLIAILIMLIILSSLD